MAERVKIKEKMKGLVSKKRGATEAELDADILEEPIPDTTNDVRTCVDTSIFDFGEEVSANSDEEGERDIGNEDFLDETFINRKTEFDNVIKLWIRYMPDWKTLYPEELGDKTTIVVTDLDRVDLKVLMEDIGENHNYGLLPFMMKSSRGQLGALNAKSFSERINSASKIVLDEGNCRMGYDMLNKLVTLRMNRKFMESRRH